MKRNTPSLEEQLLLPFPSEPHLEQAELFDFPGRFECRSGRLRFIAQPKPAEAARVGVREAGLAVQFPGAEAAS